MQFTKSKRSRHSLSLSLSLSEPLEARTLLSAPVLVGTSYDYQHAPHTVSFQFAAPIDTSEITVGALQVRNLFTNSDVDVSSTAFTYNSTSKTLTFTLPSLNGNGVFSDGNYIARLLPDYVSDGNGHYLAGQEEFEFFFWKGDLNHDRDINITDLSIVADHWQYDVTSYSEGDTNYDGVVDITDLSAVAGKWQTTLAEPPGANLIGVTATGSNTIVLTWAKVAGCTGYRIQWSDTGDNFQFLKNANEDGDDTLSYEVTGLQEGKRYWFRVRAYGGNVDTAYSPKDSAITVLPAPYPLTAAESGPGTALLNWVDRSSYEDGFVVERSDDHGSTWGNPSALPAGTVSSSGQIGSWAAEPMFRVRAFRVALDSSLVYSAPATAPVQPATPTVSQAPSASPATITTTSTTVSVLGAVPRGENFLTYTWSAIDKPSGAPNPVFTPNGTNTAKNASVTFFKAGAYTLQVEMANGDARVEASVRVTVEQTLTSISVSPSIATLWYDAYQEFSATARDQFGHSMEEEPEFGWEQVAGNGTLGGPLYQAPSNDPSNDPPNATIRVSVGEKSATALVVPMFSSSRVSLSVSAGVQYSPTLTWTEGASPQGVTFQPWASDDLAMMLGPGESIQVIDGGSSVTIVIPDDAILFDNTEGYWSSGAWDDDPVVLTNESGTATFSFSPTTQYDHMSDLSSGGFVVRSHTSGVSREELDERGWIDDGIVSVKMGLVGDQGKLDTQLIFAPAKPDLDVDSNNDGAISESDDSIEDEEGTPGVVIRLNDDDDDANGIPDWQQAGAPTGEDDLVPMNIAPPDGTSAGTLKLRIVSGSTNVRVWSSAARTGSPLLGLGVSNEDLSWSIGSEPQTVWLEGVGQASSNLGDIRFVLLAAGNGAGDPVIADAARAVNAMVSIVKLEPSSGFDTVAGVDWLMVPNSTQNGPGQNSFTAMVQPAGLVGQVVVTSTIPANASISNVAAGGNPGQLTVTVQGHIKSSNAIVDANVGAKKLASVRITVKDRKDVSVAVFSASDPNIAIPVNEPTAHQISQALENVFGRQANVHFTVLNNAVQGFNVQYDGLSNQDLQMQNPANQGIGQNQIAEFNAIAAAAPFVVADKLLYFVNAIEPPAAGGDSYGWAHPNKTQAVVATYVAQQNPPVMNPVDAAKVLIVTAHELGHLLGLSDLQAPNQLMTGDLNLNPGLSFRLTKAEWDTVNP